MLQSSVNENSNKIKKPYFEDMCRTESATNILSAYIFILWHVVCRCWAVKNWINSRSKNKIQVEQRALKIEKVLPHDEAFEQFKIIQFEVRSESLRTRFSPQHFIFTQAWLKNKISKLVLITYNTVEEDVVSVERVRLDLLRDMQMFEYHCFGYFVLEVGRVFVDLRRPCTANFKFKWTTS